MGSPLGSKISSEIYMTINAQEPDIELEKAEPMITVEIIEYVENSVVIKTILKKSSGNISVMSVDTGEGLTERTSPLTLLPR